MAALERALYASAGVNRAGQPATPLILLDPPKSRSAQIHSWRRMSSLTVLSALLSAPTAALGLAAEPNALGHLRALPAVVRAHEWMVASQVEGLAVLLLGHVVRRADVAL